MDMNAQLQRRRATILSACVSSLLCLFLLAPCALAQSSEQSESSDAGQSFLGGNRMRTNREKGTVTFLDDVKFIRNGMSTFCDELTIYYTSEQEVEKAIAVGNVQLTTEDVTATGEQATFYLEEQKVEIEGNAKAGQGNNTITAHRIIAWLETNMIEGYGDATERVLMTVYSQPAETSSTESQPETAEPAPSVIVIESDTVKYDEAVGNALFTGKVKATQNGTDINASEMRVYLAGSEAENNTDIERIEVAGNVRIIQETVVITGESGVYLNAENTAVIKGNADAQASAEDQNSVLKADTITLLMATNDIQATGNVSFEALLPEPTKETSP
jgi:lipopolysaccharide transport protein LptA